MVLMMEHVRVTRGMMEHVRVTRGMVFATRAIDNAGLTWSKAAGRAETDPATLGRVLKGKPPGLSTIAKLRDAFGTDVNLWLEDASPDEQAEWEQRIEAMRSRASQAVLGKDNARAARILEGGPHTGFRRSFVSPT